MKLDEYLGNTETIDRLKTGLCSGTLSHAILLSAPDGCGRGYLARLLAADFLYPQGGPGALAVVEMRDPEFLIVQGEGRSGNIPVEAIRNVRSAVYHSSLSSKGRVVWIKDAHRMMAPSANALLKVLEEPPEGVTFLLTTRDPSALPLTIQSRCTHYPLRAADPAQCREVLEKNRPDEVGKNWPRQLALLYAGRIGKGLKAMADPQRLEIVEDALLAAKAADKRDTYEWLRIFSRYEGRAEGDNEKRDALLSDITDALETSLLGQWDWIGLDPQKAARILPAVSETRVILRGNAAPKTTFAVLALQMAKATA